MTSKNEPARRLIEEWLPINELSIEAIRERAGAVPNPAPHQLHVWWARRPLAPSRAAVAASLLLANAGHASFIDALGTYPGIVDDQRRIEEAKTSGQKLEEGYANRRAFTHNLTPAEANWLRDNLAVSDPLVVDITAGGGSIPIEAGRLGIRNIANEINPVAAFILRATCQWPQQYGYDLLDTYSAVSTRFRKRVKELLEGVYPAEPQLPDAEKLSEFKTTRAQRNWDPSSSGRASFSVLLVRGRFLCLQTGG